MQCTPKSYDQAFYKGSNTKQYLFDCDLICGKLYGLTRACTEIFARILFSRIALKDKRHDLPILLNDRVISLFHEGIIFTKL